MNTLRAVEQMSKAEIEGMDGERTVAASHLNRRAPGAHTAALQAIKVIAQNNLHPEEDRATQLRLATAIERNFTDRSNPDPSTQTRAILTDFFMQEAAAARMAGIGSGDPLGHLESQLSDRAALRASDLLKRSGLNPHAIFDRASDHDMAAIASGRFSDMQGQHTQFAISAQLRLNSAAMSLDTSNLQSTAAERPTNALHPPVLSKGPQQKANTLPVFGRAGLER